MIFIIYFDYLNWFRNNITLHSTFGIGLICCPQEIKNDLYNIYSPGSSGWTSLRDPEFQEADILEGYLGAKASDSLPKRLQTTSARNVPKPNKTSEPPKIGQQSAPVSIPDSSKIYGSSSKKSTLRNSYSLLSGDSDVDYANHRSSKSEDEYEEVAVEEEWHDLIPPHEWIARKVSRSEIFSFSVCEGAGRTLKGRDLSRVRNAVLTRTGFLESNSRY
ncbi:phospholipase D C-like [Dorcoceras hygrometricum]|uniref:Phospholipase D C-like n=1 Tax=Dorcoceras hygrometricum TaxID=472368 RepID=A0A2Z7BDE1_9LAMI|nr:phospholipase D C-like [Dorcoceras hygrometricum]